MEKKPLKNLQQHLWLPGHSFSHTYDHLQQFKNSTWLLLVVRPFNKAFATDTPKDFLHWRQRKEKRLLFHRANPPQFPATQRLFPMESKTWAIGRRALLAQQQGRSINNTTDYGENKIFLQWKNRICKVRVGEKDTRVNTVKCWDKSFSLECLN